MPGPRYPALDLADVLAAFRPAQERHSRTEGCAPYPSSFLLTERHLQGVRFDSHLRPDTFRLPAGGQATVLDPGERDKVERPTKKN